MYAPDPGVETPGYWQSFLRNGFGGAGKEFNVPHLHLRPGPRRLFYQKPPRPHPHRHPERLWSFLGGIARKNGFKAIAIGGTENHVHALLSLPATMPLSKAVQLINGASSKWMNDLGHNFAWQEGYGAFTVGVSGQADTIRYINAQQEHHRKRSFEEEFVALKKSS
jgi:putative transposase